MRSHIPGLQQGGETVHCFTTHIISIIFNFSSATLAGLPDYREKANNSVFCTTLAEAIQWSHQNIRDGLHETLRSSDQIIY